MRRILSALLLIFVIAFSASCGLASEIATEFGEALLEALDEAAPPPSPTPAPVATPSPEPTPAPNETPIAVIDMQRVGAEGFGFVDVPSNWVGFQDYATTSEVNVLQFSDPTGTSIITMQYIEAAGNLTSPEDFLNLTAMFMENIGGVGIEGARVSLNGIDSLQVYAYFPHDDTFMITFAFEVESGILNQVTVEGPADDIMQTLYYVESSFSLLS